MLSKNATSRTARLLAPIAAMLILASALVTGLLLWSAHEVDRISRQHDRDIVSLVIDRNIDRVGHDQEGSTVWDTALEKITRRPLDFEWLDANLGVWFHDYHGHDEVYILDGSNAPLYAMRGGTRLPAPAYDEVRSVVAPIVAAERKRTKPIQRPHEMGTVLSPGFADLVTVHGHPAIVSAKPIIGDTLDHPQPRGTEPVHVSIVYLDGLLITRLREDFGLAGGRYSPINSPRPDEASVPLRKSNGQPIGYFIWRPFAPGGEVTRMVGPMLAVALLIAGLVVFMLARRLGLKTIDLETSRAQAQHLAFHDVLTGLPNRAMFESRLDAALARSARDGSRVALLCIDLDRFKQVNDTLGHPAGDALIREVGRRLLAQVRAYDTVARIGGDEFAIIQIAPRDQAAIDGMATRIVEELGQPFDLLGVQSYIGASVGVAVAPEDGNDRNELNRKADIALYKAKLGGRGRYAFFCPAMDEAIKTREEIDRDLRKAIADCDNQLTLRYQPVFSTATGTMTSVEALLRWNHPERGLVPPAAFISFAEESGLIEGLGEWVLRNAMRDAVRWPGIRLAVNVSPVQVRKRAFADRVAALLAESTLAPENLELEITETALMEGSAEIADTLSRLRAGRIAIALDDFGTGYSSLSHIRDLAVDRIKIDRSFVTAIETGHGAALVQAIVGLARANGLRITAEGVETYRQHEYLESVGCDELQGFLLSSPVSADEITALYLATPRPTETARYRVT